MNTLTMLGLFVITGIAEVFGCWLVLRWWQGLSPAWWAIPAAAAALALFAWLLTLHPMASGRIYAAYGGIYVLVSLGWLVAVDREPLTRYDLIGTGLCVIGTLFIYLQPKPA